MFDAKDLVRFVKKIASDVYKTSKPAELQFGVVTAVNPLKIKIEQKLTLSDVQIITTEKSNNLTLNDKVVLLRNNGGQSYVVIDKVVDR